VIYLTVGEMMDANMANMRMRGAKNAISKLKRKKTPPYTRTKTTDVA
jgi:hypothetical protein